MKLGYACINTTLANKKIRINRGMIKRTYIDRGPEYAVELSELNIQDMKSILLWNNNNSIQFYRMSSDILQWGADWFGIDSTVDDALVRTLLKQAGGIVKKNKHRVSFHPDHFCVLPSPRVSVVENTIRDLNLHGFILDAMGLDRTPYYKINIHCNGVYGDKQKAMDRFCFNFDRLHESARRRLTVENDDKASMYSVLDLTYIHKRTGVPIVFDYHHHTFNTGGLSEEEALQLAISTWPDNITPVVHYSESKALHENNDTIKPQAHSDMIMKLPNIYNNDVDIMVEAKSKEQSIINFI